VILKNAVVDRKLAAILAADVVGATLAFDWGLPSGLSTTEP